MGHCNSAQLKELKHFFRYLSDTGIRDAIAIEIAKATGGNLAAARAIVADQIAALGLSLSPHDDFRPETVIQHTPSLALLAEYARKIKGSSSPWIPSDTTIKQCYEYFDERILLR